MYQIFIWGINMPEYIKMGYDKFQIGDVAIATEHCTFINGTKHEVGQHIIVDNINVHYFNCWHDKYKLLENKNES